VQRVQEIAKADPGDVFTDIGNQLGTLMDAYDAISKAFLKEQMDAKQVYKGEESIGRRALKRILITSRLDAMLAEIRETMVFKAPPELGSLWEKFEKMWQQTSTNSIMATQKKNTGNQGKGGMGLGSGVRSYMGGGNNVANNEKRDTEDVPWSLIVVVLSVLLMFFIVMPVLAFMYYDMYFATQAAVSEVKKMRELRKEIQIERMYGK